jgi:hypothetical protein
MSDRDEHSIQTERELIEGNLGSAETIIAKFKVYPTEYCITMRVKGRRGPHRNQDEESRVSIL